MQKLETEPKAGQGDWTICRICLNKCVTLDLNEDMNDSKHSVNLPLNNTNKNKYYSLFQTLPDSNTPTSFHHMIMAISSVRFSMDDGLPNKLCKKCASDIVNAYSLKIKCEKSQAWLEKTLREYNPHLNSVNSIKEEMYEDHLTDCNLENSEKYLDALSDFDHNYKKLSLYIDNMKHESVDVKSDHEAYSESGISNDQHYSSSDDSPIVKMKIKLKKKTKTKIKKSKTSNVCPICECVEKDSSNLKRHMKTHDNCKPYACNQCSYKCARSSKLKEHMKIHTGEKPFLCDQCHYTCRTISNLNKHKSSKHSTERNFACDECNFKTKTKNALEVHKRRHSGDKRFVCEFCPYKAIQKARLEVHIKMVHTGERPYACNQCSYRCVDSSYLKIHLRTHCVKTFSCDECGYSCHTKFKLKMHKLTHTGEKPHKCSMCDFKCSRTTLLRRHHKRIHKIESK